MKTLAEGLRVPAAAYSDLILRDLRESNGDVAAVSERTILETMRRCAELEGLLLCPEGATALAGCAKLAREGKIRPNESAVVYNTASAYKYPDALRQLQQL